MKQDETIRSQNERQVRGPEYDRLEVLIGKWINVGKTEPMGDEPPLDITTSDIYEWLPGKYWILHTAYGRLGNMDVGGVEIIGYDREAGQYVSYFYDSRGNSSEHEIIVDGNTLTWKGKVTGCADVFSEKGKVQTAHHVRLDDNGRWVPSMEVVLTKVNESVVTSLAQSNARDTGFWEVWICAPLHLDIRPTLRNARRVGGHFALRCDGFARTG